MTLSWNIVVKNIHPHEQLQAKLREKISKLERHLQHFSPDAVHLHVALDRNRRKGVFTAALSLRVPSNILRSVKSAADPIPALDQSVRALLRELASFKSSLRRESAWKRKGRHEDLPERKPVRFAPLPLGPGEGPQTPADLVRGLIAQQYDELLHHIRRQLWWVETERAIPTHAVDAVAVADEVARQAISRANSKPSDRSFRLWLYSMARVELERRIRDLRNRAVTDISLEETPEPPHLASRDEGYVEGEPISLFGERQDQLEREAGDFLPDSHQLPPDLAASEKDLIDHFQSATHDWPREDRSVFELHFLDGFEPEEIAMLEKMKTSQVKELIKQVQARLREVLTDAMQVKASKRPRISAANRMAPLPHQP